MIERECGAVPEDADKDTYYDIRYEEHLKHNFDWQAVIYHSNEVFDPDDYNEKSVKRESKITFQ